MGNPWENGQTGTWEEWGKLVLHEIRRLGQEQASNNAHIAEFLQFKAETKGVTRATAIIVSSIFGLVSLAVTVYISVIGAK